MRAEAWNIAVLPVRLLLSLCEFHLCDCFSAGKNTSSTFDRGGDVLALCPGCRRDKDGYYWITGRIDDMLNVSGKPCRM